MADYGKLNFSVAFDPTSAFPLDARSYFTSLTDAEAAAQTAEEAGSKNTVYYYGQKILVYENGVASWYKITPSKTLEPEAVGSSSTETPHFNLTELGLPDVIIGNENVGVETDTTEIITALANGVVRFTLNIGVAGVEAFPITCTMTCLETDGAYICNSYFGIGTLLQITVIVAEGAISATAQVVTAESDESSSVQPDYTQNDTTAADYIKNRPFYEVPAVLDFLPSTEVTFEGEEWMTTPTAEQLSMWASDWDSVVVIWDGVEYTRQPLTYMGVKCAGKVLGNEDTGEPFAIACADASTSPYGVDMLYILDVSGSSNATHTVQILINGAEVHKLDSKFIDDVDYETRVINKPFGVISAGTVIFNEDVTLDLDSAASDDTPAEYYANGSSPNLDALFDGASYTVTVDDISETGVCVYDAANAMYAINLDTIAFGAVGGQSSISIQSNDYTEGQTVSVSVVLAEDYVKQIDSAYIPSAVPPASVDLSAYESGTIVETYADGTTKTTTVEFDDDGNPIKITDGDGNVTELTW